MVAGSIAAASAGAFFFLQGSTPHTTSTEPTAAHVSVSLPHTRTGPDFDLVAGEKVPNPYLWLEASSSPEVVDWAAKQQAYTEAMAANAPARPWLREQLRQLMGPTLEAPIARGDRLFYVRRGPDEEQSSLWVKTGSGPARLLLDPNTWGKERGGLGKWSPSLDGRYVAFEIQAGGREYGVIRVLDLETGQWTKDDIVRNFVWQAPVWEEGGQSFLYNRLLREPKAGDSSAFFRTETARHVLGQPFESDVVVNPARPDTGSFQISVISSDAKHVLTVIGAESSDREIFWKRVGDASEAVEIAKSLGTGQKWPINVIGGRAVFTTDVDAPRGRLVSKDLMDPRARWVDVAPTRADATLEEVVGNDEGNFLLRYSKEGSAALEAASLDSPGKTRTIPLPGMGSVWGMQAGKGGRFFIEYADLTRPMSVLTGSFDGGPLKIHAVARDDSKMPPLTMKRVSWTSADGTRVGGFLLQRADLDPKTPRPTLVLAYGGFGVSVMPGELPHAVAWVRAGGNYLLQNVRGGGEQGKHWHEQAMGPNRVRSYEDIHAGVRFLVKEGIAPEGKVVGLGFSNGANAMLWTAAEHPEDFGAVLVDAPITDLVRYPLLGMGTAWVFEYGLAPGSKLGFRHVSAYHHILEADPQKRLPLVVVCFGDQDMRVPGHAQKVLAALQARPGGRAYGWVTKEGGHRVSSRAAVEIAKLEATLAVVMERVGLNPTAR